MLTVRPGKYCHHTIFSVLVLKGGGETTDTWNLLTLCLNLYKKRVSVPVATMSAVRVTVLIISALKISINKTKRK